MATPNPPSNLNPASPDVSVKTIAIAGILTDVYGLEELSPTTTSVSCLWLLHGRLQKKEVMAQVAALCIRAWNAQSAADRKVGLIAAAFDQRNHGTRKVDVLANQSWKKGNDKHAQDMFSILNGTAIDTTNLIDHLGSYIFYGPNEQPSIDQHVVLGKSLGGHAAWQLLFNEPRITAAVVIIGCPDYMRVMYDRARNSKRESFGENGSSFFHSKDFPTALISSIKKWDPKGILFGESEITRHPSASEQTHLRTILDSKIKNKKVLICSGGDDRLVPYRCSKQLIRFLEVAVGGWYKDGNVYVEDKVYDGVGHEFSEGMEKDTARFICDILAGTLNTQRKEEGGKPVSMI